MLRRKRSHLPVGHPRSTAPCLRRYASRSTKCCTDICRKEIVFSHMWGWWYDVFLSGLLRVQIEEIGWKQLVSATGDGVSCLTFRVVYWVTEMHVYGVRFDLALHLQ
ncbi:zinc ion binding [Zea mays]|uniref:Zinc ion binding n=1 Tax=Zea mays TaxID=4577 RepID=A0A1D6HJA1_MAIZE|nr:zinc ion binding [Zea mays]AQK74560.1 zinc ion binding [Zea mays]